MEKSGRDEVGAWNCAKLLDTSGIIHTKITCLIKGKWLNDVQRQDKVSLIASKETMAFNYPPGLTPPEIAFICEMELVTVIPRQRLDGLDLLGVSDP